VLKEDQRMMIMKTEAKLSIGHLLYRREEQLWNIKKFCSHWVPYLLMDEHSRAHMDVSSQLL